MAGGGGKRGFVPLVALACAAVAATPTARAAATTDTAGGNRSGHATIQFPRQHVEASDVAVQADGKIVVSGTAYTKRTARFALARMLPDGRLDRGFGDRGRVTTDFGGRSQLLAITILPDGKIVAAGYVGGAAISSPHDFLVARYRPDGTLDPSFGSAGSVRVDFGGDDYASALDIRADGRIVVGGSSDLGNPTADDFESRLAVARLNADGSPDPGFGGTGTASASLGGFNLGLAVKALADEDVSVAGLHTLDPFALPQDSLGIARFSSNGSLDAGFGDAGTLTRDLTTREGRRVRDVEPSLGAVEFAADGSIVAATEVAIYTRRKLKYEAWIARFGPNGSPDLDFGGDGYTWVGERTLFTPVTLSLEARGSLHLAGYRFGRRDISLALVHLGAGGSLDRGFGHRGRARIPFRGVSSYPSALATEIAGQIVVAGSSVGTYSPHTGLPVKPARMAIARYTAGGRLDHSFGPRGRDHRGSVQRIATPGPRPSSLPATELIPPAAGSPCRAGSRIAPRRRC